jgi:TIR domain
MAHTIFISYRRQDSSFFAAKLKDRLEQVFPGEVFLDISGIDAGEDFVKILKSAVNASKAVLVVIGDGWASARDGRMRLGEPGDFVTEEVATALDAGIATMPLLIEGARMPPSDELPTRLRGLATLHALSISHERFDSDMTHVLAALYKPLGVQPPSRLERILELISARARFSQRMRNQQAWISLGLGIFAAASAATWAYANQGEPQYVMEPLLVAAIAVVTGMIGRYSQRRRRLALGGIGIAVLTSVACLTIAFRRAALSEHLVWLEAAQLAQQHASLPELPADKVIWSPSAPFSTPLPSVECECLAAGDMPPGPLPYREGSVVFSNRCVGLVTFVLSRNGSATMSGAFAWIPLPGREFAVITLAPKQSVRIAVGGSYGGAIAPWECVRHAPGQP